MNDNTWQYTWLPVIFVSIVFIAIIAIVYFFCISNKPQLHMIKEDNTNFFYGKSGDKRIIDYGRTDSLDECQTKCLVDEKCGGYTHTPTGLCWGFNTYPLNVVYEEGRHSGYKANPFIKRII